MLLHSLTWHIHYGVQLEAVLLRDEPILLRWLHLVKNWFETWLAFLKSLNLITWFKDLHKQSRRYDENHLVYNNKIFFTKSQIFKIGRFFTAVCIVHFHAIWLVLYHRYININFRWNELLLYACMLFYKFVELV